jgi:predicted ATPase
MQTPFIRRLLLDGFLSFAPGTEPFELQPLNVLIGPNGSGKSNVVEALELLRATPTDLATAIRDGGGPLEWLWKGTAKPPPAIVDVELDQCAPTGRPLRYHLEFGAVQSRIEVLDEAIEEVGPVAGKPDVLFYYRFQRGRPAINVRNAGPKGKRSERRMQRDTLIPDQSVLAQRKDPDLYPEVTWLGQQFGAIQIFREWTFGRYTALRKPQPAGLPDDYLLNDASNLALVLNQIEHKDPQRLNGMLKRFFPRFERMSTRVSGGYVQFYLHEQGFTTPIPSTRLSDGTMRFIALLASLLAPSPPPLLCIEEPELGLHPDAVALIGDVLLACATRTQLIVTTHSDALVSALSSQPDTVVACERPGAGTILRRLDPKQLSVWLDRYRLGDLWRIGELGANP